MNRFAKPPAARPTIDEYTEHFLSLGSTAEMPEPSNLHRLADTLLENFLFSSMPEGNAYWMDVYQRLWEGARAARRAREQAAEARAKAESEEAERTKALYFGCADGDMPLYDYEGFITWVVRASRPMLELALEKLEAKSSWPFSSRSSPPLRTARICMLRQRIRDLKETELKEASK